MSSYPNMILEILDAINIAFVDEPDIKVDCLLYLIGLKYDSKRASSLGTKASIMLDEMNRCNKCGELLESIKYKEPHSEIDGCPTEDIIETYCPNCEVCNQTIIKGWR